MVAALTLPTSPPEKAAYARRDVDFLAGQAEQHGACVGLFARGLLAGPLPWTRMRRVYALIGLCRRYGDERVERTCEIALSAQLLVPLLYSIFVLDLKLLRWDAASPSPSPERPLAQGTATAAE